MSEMLTPLGRMYEDAMDERDAYCRALQEANADLGEANTPDELADAVLRVGRNIRRVLAGQPEEEK